jgi:hypothetical protein
MKVSFFSIICLINLGYAVVINLQIREKSMTFITSCTNNYYVHYSKYLQKKNLTFFYEIYRKLPGYICHSLNLARLRFL